LPLLLTLAACGAPSPTPAASPTPEPAPTEGFVVLDDDIIIDDFNFEIVTAEPVAPVTMSQAEAQSALPFAYALPAWVPPGYVLQPDVEVLQSPSGGYASLILTWLDAGEAALQLRVATAAPSGSDLGAAGASETVSVNGAPASLRQTGLPGLRRRILSWPHAGLSYSLSADAGTLAGDDLVRVAESIP
jgi:hypothetical protein